MFSSPETVIKYDRQSKKGKAVVADIRQFVVQSPLFDDHATETSFLVNLLPPLQVKSRVKTQFRSQQVQKNNLVISDVFL